MAWTLVHTFQAQASELKVARLEEYIRALKEEREISERVHSDRAARNEQVVAEVKMTNARLEASFELQKQTTAVFEKELERSQKEFDQIREENDRLRSADAQMAGKVDQLQNELIDMQRKANNYKVELHAARDEVEHARLTINRLESEIEAYKRTAFGEQQMMMSLNELTARLSRIEAEKTTSLESQIEVIRLERDSLKTSNARLTDQLSHARNDAKQVQTRFEQELSLVKEQLGEKEKELTSSERQLIDLRTRLSNMQAQYTAHESTIGMTPERLQKECQQLKNRTQYLECQLDEMKAKLAEAESIAMKKSDENERMESHSNVLESNLKQMAELGSMERERLEARASSAEARSEELTSKVAQLSTNIDRLESEIAEMKMQQLERSTELQLRIDILEAQKKDADESVGRLNESLIAARAELEKRLSERNQIRVLLSPRCIYIALLSRRSEELTSKVAQLSTNIDRLESEIAEMKMQQLERSTELQLRIDILEAQKKDADESVGRLNESLIAARAELEKRLSERNQLSDQVTELKAALSEKEGELMLRDAKLESKEKELISASEASRVAEESLHHAEELLAARSNDVVVAEARFNDAVKQYEEKLEQILQKYENVVAQITESAATSEADKPSDLTLNPDSSGSVIESLQSVVAFLREEKQMVTLEHQQDQIL
ncbi:hypothetical protein ANCCAN_27108, partial [Ancylostoma caninum]